MILIINNCEDINFIFYIINYIKSNIKFFIDKRKLIHINNYINQLPSLKTKKIKTLDCYSIIINSLQYLQFKKFNGNNYYIYINPNIKFYDTNAKLNDVCKLINYGSLSLRGCYLYTNLFDYIKDNIELLYFDYMKG